MASAGEIQHGGQAGRELGLGGGCTVLGVFFIQGGHWLHKWEYNFTILLAPSLVVSAVCTSPFYHRKGLRFLKLALLKPPTLSAVAHGSPQHHGGPIGICYSLQYPSEVRFSGKKRKHKQN